MANFKVTSGPVAVATTSTKTILEIVAASGKPVKIWDLVLTIGTGQTGEVKVETLKFTTSGTGTSKTPVATGSDQSTAVSATCKANDTVEPSGTVTVLDTYFVQCGSGINPQWPLQDELFIPPSTGFGVRVTMPGATSTNVAANLQFKE